MPTINPYGKDIISVTTGEGRPLILEVNRVGFRTTGSVLVNYGDTVVLGSATVGSRPVVLDYSHLASTMKKSFMQLAKLAAAASLSVKAVHLTSDSYRSFD